MAFEIFKLFGSVFVDTSSANSEMDITGSKAEAMAKKFGDAADKAGKLGSSLTNAGSAMTKGITAPVAAIATGLGALIAKSVGTADEIQRLSDVSGMSSEQLQKLQYAGSALGVELTTITGAQAKLTKSMSAAVDGTGTQADAFSTLGISVLDANGNMRDANTVMMEAFDALNGVGNETERDALSMAIFGKSAMELNPLIKAGSAGLKELTDEAEKNGAVMSDEAIAGLDLFGDTIDAIKLSIMGTVGTMAAQFVPALQSLAKLFQENVLPAIAGFTEKLGGMATSFMEMDPLSQKLIGGLVGITVAAGPLLIVGGKIATGISSIMTVFQGLAPVIAGATAETTGMGTVLGALTGPIGITIAAIAAIGAIIAGAWQNSETFRTSISESFETIKNTVTGAFNQIGMAMGPAIESFLGFSANINPILKEIGDFLGIYVVPLVTQFIVTFIQGFSAIITAIAPFIAAIGNLLSFIGNFIGLVFALFTGDWSTAWTFAQNMAKNACDFIGNVFLGLGNWINLIFTGITMFLQGVWQGIYDNTVGKVIEMAMTVAAMFEEIRVGAQTKFEEIKQNIITAVQELPGRLYQAARDMLSEMVRGIQETAGNVYGAVTGLVGDVIQKFKEGFGIASPSKELFSIGKFLMQGLINGLNGDNLMSFINSMVEDIKAKFAGGSFNLKAAIDFVGTGAAEFFKSIGIGGMTGGSLPVDGSISSYFGYRDDVGDVGTSNHMGVDIAAAEGTPIYAAEGGTVSESTGSGYGNLIVIDNGSGLQEYYGHMSAFNVADGATVNKGDLIGYVGSTGNSTGPHLHFGVMQNGEWVDPLQYYGFAVGSRYIPRDMFAKLHKGEMVVPESENPYANSGGSITGGLQAEIKQPAVINLVLQNGTKLAEYLIDDINNLLGKKAGLAGRGMA